LANGNCSIDWRTSSYPILGYQTGHSHPGQEPLGNNSTSSFGACCQCEANPENQCIFLRGWRVKEMSWLLGARFAVKISVEDATKWEWRLKHITKSPTSSKPNDTSNTPAQGVGLGLVEEAEGSPSESEIVSTRVISYCPKTLTEGFHIQPDLYDVISVLKYQVSMHSR
jgi:hypothetical protein